MPMYIVQQNPRIHERKMSEINWHRVLAISALLTAFILIVGSIYLHLQQKHHLGRLHHENFATYTYVEPEFYEFYSSDEDVENTEPTEIVEKRNEYEDRVGEEEEHEEEADEEEWEEGETEAAAASNGESPWLKFPTIVTHRFADDTSENESSTSTSYETESYTVNTERNKKQCGNNSWYMDKSFAPPLHISENCLQCICETTTECHSATCGLVYKMPCGVFRISQPYWIDAGKPTVRDDTASGNINANDDNVNRDVRMNNEYDDYKQCVNDECCSARAVDAFVSKYAQDCNHDGIIDCRDHVKLHLLGPTGCIYIELLEVFQMRLERCLARYTSF